VHAEATGLVEFSARVRFRHPLVRSAVYRAAPLEDRRWIHRLLADAIDPEVDPDRRAWHRAQAAREPDEPLAEELETSAGHAQARGGLAAAAAFMQRAAELTPEPATRVARMLTAAQIKHEAGAPEAAQALLSSAETGSLDRLQRARLERLRAQIAFTQRPGGEAARLLLAAAKRLESLDASLARETYLEAMDAAVRGGRLGSGPRLLEIAEAARAAPRPPGPPAILDVLLDGWATQITQGSAAAAPTLKCALRTLRSMDIQSPRELRWLWLGCRSAMELWDDTAWYELASRQARFARDNGAITVLPNTLNFLATYLVHAGDFADAAALLEEADTLINVTGGVPHHYAHLMLAAWSGQAAHTSELAESAVNDAHARGEGRVIAMAEYATALLHNGLGSYETALAAAERTAEFDDLATPTVLVELIEAATRTGDLGAAHEALDELSERTQASGSPWALGMEAGSRALVTDRWVAEHLYREAIERLGDCRIATALARAHLLYGEWLRREGRRIDARAQLRKSHEMFSSMGAAAFAGRAERELHATGGRPRRRTVDAREQLTPRELTIARLAATRATSKEIAGELFVSPRTVDAHLRSIFTKLGISSRRQLRDLQLPRSVGRSIDHPRP
jgi:DNA-binding CsgD family transcriptional regulator